MKFKVTPRIIRDDLEPYYRADLDRLDHEEFFQPTKRKPNLWGVVLVYITLFHLAVAAVILILTYKK